MQGPILIVRGHPAPEGGHFCDALVDAYVQGAQSKGHLVDIVDIAALNLPCLREASAWNHPATDTAILDLQARIAAACHLVFIYPLWLGDMPALLKAFLEQVSCGGFIVSTDETGHWKQGLKGKSARLIVTMGMPALAYRFFYFSHSVRSFSRNILQFGGAGRVEATIIGSVEKSAEHRKGWIAAVRRLGEAAA